jgi:SAM-dependent methyltransferase
MSALPMDTDAIRAGWHAWLDHPTIARHYRERALIDGLPWDAWVARRLGDGPARSLELGCVDGARSFQLFERGYAHRIDGLDPSEALVARAEQARRRARAPGEFTVADLNACRLPAATYDIILASHVLHQVAALESLLDQVHYALTPRGVFVVEGFVGPSRFQWTDAQIELVKVALAWLPERLRRYRSGDEKVWEARPDREAITALSAVDGIRSGEIRMLFGKRFEAVAVRPLGGTIQNLLYSGIVHNFAEDDPEAVRGRSMTARLEDTLIDTGLLPSDFMLIIGRRR